MTTKLEEKRKRIEDAKRAAKLEGRDYVEPNDDGDNTGEEVGKPDPSETNKVGQPAAPDGVVTEGEAGVSDPNRDTDTHGATDGLTGTSGYQHGNNLVLPQTTDPDVNPTGAGLREPTDEEIAEDTGGQDPKEAEAARIENTSPRTSERTNAELQRGAEAVKVKTDERDSRLAREPNTVVTDYKEDPTGEKGRKALDAKASKKADAKK